VEERAVNKGLVIGPIVLLAALVLLPGCGGPPPSRVQFNENFADRNTKLYKAGRAFRKSLDPLLKENRKPILSDVKKARDDAKDAYEEVSTEFRASRLPRKQGNASAMFDAYKDFLDTEEEIINKDFDQIIKVLENDKEFQALDEKKNAIEDIIDAIETKESKKLKAFRTEQESYAKAFNFQVGSPPQGGKSQKGGDKKDK
jgi:hypothetical protein